MKFASAAASALLFSAPAFAVPTVIDFDTAPSFESIGEFYNGGAGGALGVSFTGDAIGLANDFETYFTNAPSPIGVMTPVGTDATMNVAGGFTDSVSFSYSSSAFIYGITVYEGLNGTGKILASFNLTKNAQANGCFDSAYCYFDRVSSTFAGTARSISFGTAAENAVFDNISFTAAVPEPSAYLLFAAGLLAVGVVKRRRDA